MPVPPEQPFLDFVAANVRRRREGLGLTQERMAEQGGFDIRYFRFIETAERNISMRTLVRLAEVLECGPADLLQPARATRRKPGRPRKATNKKR